MLTADGICVVYCQEMNTALHIAADRGLLSIVKLLIAAHAIVNVTNKVRGAILGSTLTDGDRPWARHVALRESAGGPQSLLACAGTYGIINALSTVWKHSAALGSVSPGVSVRSDRTGARGAGSRHQHPEQGTYWDHQVL